MNLQFGKTINLKYDRIPNNDLTEIPGLTSKNIDELLNLASQFMLRLRAIRVFPQPLLKEDPSGGILNLERLFLWEHKMSAGSDVHFRTNGSDLVLYAGGVPYTLEQARAICSKDKKQGVNPIEVPEGGVMRWDIQNAKQENQVFVKGLESQIDKAIQALTAAKHSLANGQAAWQQL